MKPILNKIAIIAGLSLLASCQSFFDEDPVYSTTTDTFFNSETALETYAIGFLESHLPSAATLTRGDQYSDICVTTQTEGFLKTGGYSAQQANNWARGNWRPLYNVNYYLKHMKDAAPYVDDATMKHYEGVGRFWRAWFYWDKVKTFGDVPWYDEPIDPDATNSSTRAATRATTSCRRSSKTSTSPPPGAPRPANTSTPTSSTAMWRWP